MAASNKKNESNEILEAVGLDATPTKEQEYDLVNSLLRAAAYKEDAAFFEEIKVERNGVFYFKFRVRPISDEEAVQARRKARVMMPNPQGRKYPQIEKDFKANVFHNWIIYLATVEEDKPKIWGNSTVMTQYECMQPADTVDVLLTSIEKQDIVSRIMEISGFDDKDNVDTEELVKN